MTSEGLRSESASGAKVALLDVNVLVALFDPDHVHHEAAHEWFASHCDKGWASCPITENGLVRILSNASYSGIHITAEAVRASLAEFCHSGHHTFWPGAVTIRDERLPLAGVTHGQITDLYLMLLAFDRGGRLATFDRRILTRLPSFFDKDVVEVIPA